MKCVSVRIFVLGFISLRSSAIFYFTPIYPSILNEETAYPVSSLPLQPQIFNREAGTGWKRRLGNQISTITHLSIFIEKTKLVFPSSYRSTNFFSFSLKLSVCPLDLVLSFQIFCLHILVTIQENWVFSSSTHFHFNISLLGTSKLRNNEKMSSHKLFSLSSTHYFSLLLFRPSSYDRLNNSQPTRHIQWRQCGNRDVWV